MCDICNRTPCDRFCPNEYIPPENEVVCEICDTSIDTDEKYAIDIYGVCICKNCIKEFIDGDDFTFWEIIENLGAKVKKVGE